MSNLSDLPPEVRAKIMQRHLLGESAVGEYSTINLPKQVRVSFQIKPGDTLQWYPSTISFPDEQYPDVIAVLVRRKAKEDETHGESSSNDRDRTS